MTDKTPFKKEYTSDVVEVIETVYGIGFLSQGGEEAAQRMLTGLDLKHKRLLDIGCGVGAPTLAVAKLEPTLQVTGVDVDADLITIAKRHALEQGFADRSEWLVSEPEGQLPFEDQQFDIVYGKESWLHVADKSSFFKECARVLKPGGLLVTLDWMHRSIDYTPQMQSFAQADGLTFHFCTLQQYQNALGQVGFKIQRCVDNSSYHLKYAQDDVAFLTGTAKATLIQKLGVATYQAYLNSWQLQVKIFESGEMQTYLIHAQKPTV